MKTPRVKICCISSPEEARLAIAHGAAALGLVSAMPFGLGVIEEQLINVNSGEAGTLTLALSHNGRGNKKI